jgi:hypothetical protein
MDGKPKPKNLVVYKRFGKEKKLVTDDGLGILNVFRIFTHLVDTGPKKKRKK